MKNRRSAKKPLFRVTPQRAEILRLLDGNKSHPSAEEIYRRVSCKFSGMSFATVYNTLESLLALGRVRDVNIDPARKRFDPVLKPHQHLMCVKCHSIADLKSVRKPFLPKGRPKGFRVLSCNIEFYGLCRKCCTKGS